MMRRNNAIARLAFMKLCVMMMVMILDCKSMRKTVFIAKLVISKTQRKILCGLAQRAAAGKLSKYVRPLCQRIKQTTSAQFGVDYRGLSLCWLRCFWFQCLSNTTGHIRTCYRLTKSRPSQPAGGIFWRHDRRLI